MGSPKHFKWRKKRGRQKSSAEMEIEFVNLSRVQGQVKTPVPPRGRVRFCMKDREQRVYSGEWGSRGVERSINAGSDEQLTILS